ncbi:AUGMIN subunit 5 [Dichanthelium oligosanthes]|uniref:AUGMIN subunit 5 n=1 Tax=Dichanthelium oligosanthes TaxID=888268 RepID=A0A1E5VPG0_9POAL|nr:AUGMIN subunit 5 [Dichanthelium oligosanthes]
MPASSVSGGSGPGGVSPDAIIEWLQDEMGYPSAPPAPEQLRKICRGNMIPVWSFLLRRVRSERTVATARRNILVHGVAARRAREGGAMGVGAGDAAAREAEARERDLAAEEAERLRGVVRRQRKELRARIAEVAREEAERKRVLGERSNARHKQVMLEAYEQQCDEACKVFAEYQRRLHQFVNQARDVRRSSIGVSGAAGAVEDMQLQSDRDDLYSSTIKSNRLPEDLVETAGERNIRKACETLAADMVETIRSSFPAFEGSGINSSCQLDAAKLGIDLDGEIPTDVKAVAMDSLKHPSLLLQSIITYTSRMKTLIHRETDKIDIRADAELLSRILLDGLAVYSRVYGNGKTGSQLSTRGTYDQLLERQKEHVQQFLATEDALNKAAEAKALSQKLLQRLHGTVDMAGSKKLPTGNTAQNMTNSRHLELDVWAKEREVAGLKASLSTLTSEVQRLYKLCAEWKEAEDSLKKKWKKIEEFDARRSELECIYNALQRANMDASAFWEQQPLSARGYASSTIIPACNAVVDMSTNSRDLIERELAAFGQSLDNSLCRLPATPQALLEAVSSSGVTGSEALAAAEKHAALLTARAVSPGAEGTDSGLASVLNSLEFCLKPCGSEASILEDLSKAINLVHTRRNLVENDRVLLNRAHRAQQEYERVANYCLKLAGEQEKAVSERWLPELRNAVQEARRCFEDCQRVRGLVDEWYEQPAATIVDWVTIDGQSVGAWINLVKQLHMEISRRTLAMSSDMVLVLPIPDLACVLLAFVPARSLVNCDCSDGSC